MRPVRLDLEGFASYRDPVTIDFTDADLFVLAGPTGSGKSSVVDALTFALYGTVPRYDDRRVVAPVISQGAAEARVRLDFTVGSRTYSAVRVVRRTRTGATTKEARLERWRGDGRDDTVVLAGTADELTEQVEGLLGLRFEHFTSCIVLPQGAFQQFLHAKPRERQDLLVQLLDLAVYRRVGEAARDRARELEAQVTHAERRLDGELAQVTEQVVTELTDRVEELDALVTELEETQPELDEIRDQGGELRAAAQQAQARVTALDSVTVPDGVEGLVARVTDAADRVATCEAAVEDAGTTVEKATAALEQAGDPTALTQQQARLTERTGLTDRLTQARQVAEAAAVDRDAAAAVVTAAREHLAEARAGLHTAERHDLVAAVTAGLSPGDPCPVCATPLDQLPDAATDAVTAATTVVTEAEAAVESARTALQSAEATVARTAADRDSLTDRVSDLDAATEAAVTAGLPVDLDTVRAQLDALTAHQQAVTTARQAERAARADLKAARDTADEVRQDQRAAWEAFDRVWQQVADLAPPPTDRDDLAGAWTALADWADRRRPELADDAKQAQHAVDEAVDRWKAIIARLRQACLDHQVPVPEGTTPRDAAVRAAEHARQQRATAAERLDQARQLRTQMEAARRGQRLAHELGQHLKSSNFEKWLLNRALQRLVAGATRLLSDLSDGAYSLTLDESSGFAVIDHRNADQMRSARTLSGGETFLASLALALALSEHVADLAAQGAARLESLILDEGFGTLDGDTLDVVATALEELGSRGRMVGVITHVNGLAQRLPVRFEVRKEAGTSRVERHDDGTGS